MLLNPNSSAWATLSSAITAVSSDYKPISQHSNIKYHMIKHKDDVQFVVRSHQERHVQQSQLYIVVSRGRRRQSSWQVVASSNTVDTMYKINNYTIPCHGALDMKKEGFIGTVNLTCRILHSHSNEPFKSLRNYDDLVVVHDNPV